MSEFWTKNKENYKMEMYRMTTSQQNGSLLFGRQRKGFGVCAPVSS